VYPHGPGYGPTLAVELLILQILRGSWQIDPGKSAITVSGSDPRLKRRIVGDRIDGWRVCWVGGWDKGKVLFVVMMERVVRASVSNVGC
jgi:hypothetical protein